MRSKSCRGEGLRLHGEPTKNRIGMQKKKVFCSHISSKTKMQKCHVITIQFSLHHHLCNSWRLTWLEQTSVSGPSFISLEVNHDQDGSYISRFRQFSPIVFQNSPVGSCDDPKFWEWSRMVGEDGPIKHGRGRGWSNHSNLPWVDTAGVFITTCRDTEFGGGEFDRCSWALQSVDWSLRAISLFGVAFFKRYSSWLDHDSRDSYLRACSCTCFDILLMHQYTIILLIIPILAISTHSNTHEGISRSFFRWVNTVVW
jgi:hypothetical protein